MRFNFFVLYFLTTLLFAEDPWGQDCDLIYKKPRPKSECRSTPIQQFATCCIQFHQNIISPADGPRSHFFPSSSQYTKEAIQKYGFIQGFFLGCDRLMRENNDPWIYSTCTGPENTTLKCNPVP
ncbi:membrane protein insertion efficiency factor YidD [Chlamydiales bacterium]|nr:membrane protein insertion efficiency factor YidD [Chlamydiales bacterium]